MVKKIKKIPVFKSLEEEAKFWDTHSFADYWGQLKDVDLVVQLSKPKEEALVVRLQKDVKDGLMRIARYKGLSMSVLARMWIIEKLRATKPSISSS